MPGRPTVALVSDAAGYGGAQVYLAQLASYLGARWRFVALLGERADGETVRRLTAAGAEVEQVPGLGRVPSLRGLRNLTRRLRALRPALVHVGLTDQGDGIAPLLAARLARRTTVATLHLVIPGRAAWREAVSRHVLRLPGLIVGVSESVAGYARGLGAEAAVVLNGIDPPELASDAREALELPAGAFVVGGIGRIDEQKGWDVLCAAMALVRSKRPEAIAVVIGTGPGLDELRRSPGCEAVRFAGYRERAASLLGAFDLLAVPSRYEAFGRVAAEAMFAGVPVVASSVDGLPEVVGDCGVLVPPDRPELLAEAILELAADPAARQDCATRARERARSLFTGERMAQEVERVYELVNAGPSDRASGL